MGSFNEWSSSSAAANASVGAINYSEGMFPGGLNDSARSGMLQLAEVRDGVTVATGWHVKANGLTIHDQSDSTKKVIFDVSGQTAGTTRTIGMPSTAGTLLLDGPKFVTTAADSGLSNERVLTAGTNITLTESSTAGTITIASSSVSGATQAEQENASAGATTTYVSPAIQQYHPSAAKAWIRFNGTGTIGITASYNITSLTDGGTGKYTVTVANDFSSSSSYAVVATGKQSDSGLSQATTTEVGQYAAGSFEVNLTDGDNQAVDGYAISAAAFGDQ